MTLLAGFLGSGKTTLLNRILSQEGGPKCAVLVNEFGDVGIDGKLIVAAEDDLVELQNGCVCCTVRGDLQEALGQMLTRRGSILGRAKFDRIVIEASGLASPGPIAQTLEVDGDLSDRLFLDGVITLVHAAKIGEQLTGFPEARNQVGYADLLLINHLDCLEPGQLNGVRQALVAVNGAAPMLETTRSDVDLSKLFDLERLDLLGAASSDHSHAAGVSTLALSSTAPMDIHKVKMWLRFLANRSGTEILRMKGVLRCLDQPGPVVVQAVYQWLEVGPGQGSLPAESNLVLIGQGFDPAELRRGWEACISN